MIIYKITSWKAKNTSSRNTGIGLMPLAMVSSFLYQNLET